MEERKRTQEQLEIQTKAGVGGGMGQMGGDGGTGGRGDGGTGEGWPKGDGAIDEWNHA